MIAAYLVRYDKLRWLSLVVAPAAVLLTPSLSIAGKGKMTQPDGPGGVVHVSSYVHIAFPPTQAKLDEIDEKMRDAARMLCDATDGQVLVDEIYLERNGLSADDADVIWFPESQITRFIADVGTNPYGHDAAHFRVADQVAFRAIAHEFGHLLFNLGDQYYRWYPMKEPCGIGVSIEKIDMTPADHSIMQEYETYCWDPNNGLTDKRCNYHAECESVHADATCHEFSSLASEFNTPANFELVLGDDGINYPGPAPGTRLWLSARIYAGVPSTDWVTSWNNVSYLDSEGDLNGGSDHRIWLKSKATQNPHEYEIRAYIGPEPSELSELSWTLNGGSPFTSMIVEFDPLSTHCGPFPADPHLNFNATKVNGVSGPWNLSLEISAAQLSANYAVPTQYNGGPVSLEVDIENLCERDKGSALVEFDAEDFDLETYTMLGAFVGRAAGAGQNALSTEAIYHQLPACNASDVDDRWLGEYQVWATSAQEIAKGKSDWEVIAERLGVYHGITIFPPTQVTASPTANPNGVNCQAFEPTIDRSAIQVADTIVMLIDRSGSMADDWTNGAETQRKIDWARAGAEGFAEAGSKQTGANLWLAVAGFNESIEWLPNYGPLVENSAPGMISPSDIEYAMTNGYEPTGGTAIGDAVAAGVDRLVNDPTTASAIFLLTDGESNTGISIQAASDLAVNANANNGKGIPVYVSPVGTFDASTLDPLANTTGGMMLSTLEPDEIPAAMFSMRARMRSEDLSLVHETSSVSNWHGQLPSSVQYDVVVEPGAERLVMLLTPDAAIKSTWAVDFTLSGPSGELITKNSAANVVEHDDRFYYLITVPTPSPGTWTMTLAAPPAGETPKLNPESQLLMAHVEHEGPRCRVSTSTHRIDDATQEVEVYAEAEWGGLLDDGVEFVGKVRRADGTVVTFPMTQRPSGIAEGSFSQYSHDGVYEVQVECHASATATYSAGEAEDAVATPGPGEFSRTGTAYFVLNDGLLPPECDGSTLDSDWDGIPDRCDPDDDNDDRPDSSEGIVDTDGDGVPDKFDQDSDNDGERDGADWHPTDPTGHLRFAQGDFNGDGLLDRVSGDPDYNNGAGRILVTYVGTDADEVWHQNSWGILDFNESGDGFGTAVTVADFNGDGYNDVAVGVPGEDHSSVTAPGAVNVIYGSATGLSDVGDQFWTESSSGVLGTAENGDGFGSRLAIGDFNCDGFADLVIGSPDEDIGSAVDAGAAHVLYGSAFGLSSVNDLWYQGYNGVNGGSETDDHFADSLAVADFNGDVCDDLVIGAPYEDWGGTIDAGNAYAMYGSGSGLSTAGDWTIVQGVVQHTPGADDRFATRMWTDDLNNDGFDEVVIMSPGDPCGATHKGFNYVFGSASGLTTTNNVWFCREYY